MISFPDNIITRKLTSSDFEALLQYLLGLSPETKSRFGPHAFDAEAVTQFYNDKDITGFVAVDANTNAVIAYSIIKKGILLHDKERLVNYHYFDTGIASSTYAPSVADEWQGKGIGKILFEYIKRDCNQNGIKRLILWGGVQHTNEKALRFYKKLGFVRLGQFEYNGLNLDMLLEI